MTRCIRCNLEIEQPDDHRWAAECLDAVLRYAKRLEAQVPDIAVMFVGGPAKAPA